VDNQSANGALEPDLLLVLDELRRREPIFHNKAFGSSVADFECSTAPDFWEIGASGRRYTREFILGLLQQNALVDAEEAGWKSSDFGLRRLGPDSFLLTYTLDQAGRLTRRSTIWQKTDDGWRVLYHQGTVVTNS
jgi:hypothetical protein